VLTRMYLVGAVLWAAAVLAAPQVEGRAAPHGPLFAASRLVYAAGAVVCHQRPERSFVAAGMHFPVCARCTGIYMTAGVVAVALVGVQSIARRGVRYDLLPYRWRIVLAVLAALPTVVTVVFEWSTGDVPTNAVRFFAGAPIGALVSWIATPLPRPEQQSE